MRIMKNEWNRIKLFFRNVWMILAVDLPHKVIFSFSCAVFSLFSAEAMYFVFSRVLVNLEGIQYIDKSKFDVTVCAINAGGDTDSAVPDYHDKYRVV